MSSRVRRRVPPRAARTRAANSATSRRTDVMHGRATRHASIRTYAELSDSQEEEEEEEVDDDDDDDDDDEEEEGSENDEIGPDDLPLQRTTKRPRPAANPYSSDSSPPKRRRQQPQRGGVPASFAEDEIYLSPSSDGGAARRHQKTAAAAPASASASSRQDRRARPSRRDRRDRREEARHARRTTRSKHTSTARQREDAGKAETTKRVLVREAEAAAAATAAAAAANAPPWERLPYLILARIFAYAAAPLDNIGSVRWLVAASRVCRAFAEPALRALYESPPLLTMNMAHSLVDLLAQPASATMFDYGQKVRALHIDVGSLATRVYKGRHLDIPSMVARCPRLSDLDLYHYKDMPPYRQQNENLRWTYPRSLFEALGAVAPSNGHQNGDHHHGDEQGGENQGESSSSRQHGDPRNEGSAESGPIIKLKSWRWNQRLMPKDSSLDDVRALHLSPTFAGLRKLSFVNYQRPSLHAKDADDPDVRAADTKQADTFAGLLDVLPDLRHLQIVSSTAANELLLPRMPTTLEHLELINCWDVTAAQLAEYLVTHGQQLRHLTLHHNQSLSLAFLPVLGEACPGLRSLRMNLTYYSHHAFYNDSNPLYDCLLTSDQVPAWPPGIRVIELEHLRKWEPAAAEVFFQSLVDSAPRIPMLRVLAIKAMLDIPWRQRCEMRDRWEATLNRVFKRRVRMPAPAHSLQYYQQQKAAAAAAASPMSARTKADNHARRRRDAEPQRRSHRIATHASTSSSRASSRTRGLRKASGDRTISYREPDTDEDMEPSDNVSEQAEDDGDSDGGEQNDEGVAYGKDAQSDDSAAEGGPADGAPLSHRRSPTRPARPWIHGMCDVVDIRIDNQKPGEIQYRMVDFLDSDDSGSDEEWTGDGLEANDYAW